MGANPLNPDPPADADPVLPDWAEDDGIEKRTWTLTRDSSFRLDKFLKNQVGFMSRHQLQKIIDLDGVTVNGLKPKASKKLKAGDLIELILPPRPARYLKPQAIPMHALFEDEHMVVLNKQANLTVHPAKAQTDGTMINGLAYHFMRQQHGDDLTEEKAQEIAARKLDDLEEDAEDLSVDGLSSVGEDEARPGIVHRLDKHTTGCIVVAKRDDTHWLLSRQFERRTNLKCYLALVHGCPEEPSGVIHEPITRHHTIREAMAVRHDSMAKDSTTLYRVRERYRGYSLVECELKTGRTHQIRVHLSYIGCPLVGDLLYGGEAVGEHELDHPPEAAGARPRYSFARPKDIGRKLAAQAEARDDLFIAVPALHAALLQLKHPVSDESMTFTAPLHEPLRSLVLALRQRPAPGPTVTDGTHIDLAQAIGENPAD